MRAVGRSKNLGEGQVEIQGLLNGEGFVSISGGTIATLAISKFLYKENEGGILKPLLS